MNQISMLYTGVNKWRVVIWILQVISQYKWEDMNVEKCKGTTDNHIAIVM
jgi:hypothetical protein